MQCDTQKLRCPFGADSAVPIFIGVTSDCVPLSSLIAKSHDCILEHCDSVISDGVMA
jgi:hypothetical protein